MRVDSTFGQKVLEFYKSLELKEKLPKGVEILNPYQDKDAFELCKQFYNKYYNDNETRAIILGINPGRFGGGLTGIPFTDPVKLESICHIKNDFPKKAELSADFIYGMIDTFGGPEKFYKQFYINSASPLGFTFEGKNLNYYDTPPLLKSVYPFVLATLTAQVEFGIRKDFAFCLGEGANFKFLKKLNDTHQFFKEIIPLAHPRFIMQYKRKSLNVYIKDYMKKFEILL